MRKTLFLLLLLETLLFIPPLIFSLYVKEIDQAKKFLIPLTLSPLFLFGYMKSPDREMDRWEAMVLVSFSWVVLSLICSIPYLGEMSLSNAIFESVSGVTSTGLTVVRDFSEMPRSLFFWRSYTEWIGGLGIVVFLLAVLPHAIATPPSKIYVAEGKAERIEPSVRHTSKVIVLIYSMYTLVGIILLMLAGMNLVEAINHSMTAISTGGFSLYEDSIGHFNSMRVEAVVIFLMVLGGTSFAVHHKILTGRIREVLGNPEVRAMLLLILVFSLVMHKEGIRESLFHTVSALTGTGFSISDLRDLSEGSKLLLITLMVLGGGYGSTSSALKLMRIVILFKAIVWHVRRTTLPEGAIYPLKIGGKIFSDREIAETAIYATVYLTLLLSGAAIISHLGYPITDSLFEVASAEGNVGLSLGITSPDMHLVGKTVLIIEMIAGRLEIFPLVALIIYPAKR
ncbi:TrkH family potassium uptake protein [Thermococci archaeon]|nr:MAG: TrkH family potassium uptake protein [Thermococci archaeon]